MSKSKNLDEIAMRASDINKANFWPYTDEFAEKSNGII